MVILYGLFPVKIGHFFLNSINYIGIKELFESIFFGVWQKTSNFASTYLNKSI